MATAQDKLQYVEEEIARLYRGQRAHVEQLNAKLVAALNGTRFGALDASVPESPAEVAVDNAESLVNHTTRARAFARYMDAIAKNRANGTDDDTIISNVEGHLTRALISAASYQSSQSTSWAVNVQRAAELTALADMARLFQDIRGFK